MKTPSLQRTLRAGERIGAYYVWVKGKRVNLRTQDAIEAQKRARRAARGESRFAPDVSMARRPRAARAAVDGEGAADSLIAALTGRQPSTDYNPAAQSSPPPVAHDAPAADMGSQGDTPPVIEPEIVPPEDHAHPNPEGWTEAVRDAAGAGGNSPETARAVPVVDPEIADAELAKLGVEAQLWIASTYAKQKVWKGFTPPTVPQEARDPLIEQWKKILAYCNVASVMPPWVFGLAVPAVTLITATTALAYAFAELAKEQKKQAGVEDEPQTAPANAA